MRPADWAGAIGKHEGQDTVNAFIGGFLRCNPDSRAVTTSGVDEHYKFLRYDWTIFSGDAFVLEGAGFAELGSDGCAR